MPTPLVLLSYEEVRSDTLFSLRRAAENRGIELIEVEPHRLSIFVDSAHHEVFLDGSEFRPDVLIHRTVFPYLSLLEPILQVLSERGTWVINDPGSSRISRSKTQTALALARAGIPIVSLHTVAPGYGGNLMKPLPAVSKPDLGTRGRGVRFHEDNVSLSSALDQSDSRQQDDIDSALALVEPIVIQADWSESGFDYRSYVVGGKCVALVRRMPSLRDRRTNMSRGGVAVPEDLSHPAARLSERAARTLNLDLCGVDLASIDDSLFVSEVDAWAGFAQTESVTAISIAEHVLDYSQSWTRE